MKHHQHPNFWKKSDCKKNTSDTYRKSSSHTYYWHCKNV